MICPRANPVIDGWTVTVSNIAYKLSHLPLLTSDAVMSTTSRKQGGIANTGKRLTVLESFNTSTRPSSGSSTMMSNRFDTLSFV